MNCKMGIAILLIPICCFSQRSDPAFLRQRLQMLKDSAWIDGLNELSASCIERLNRDSAQYFNELATGESKKLHYTHGLAVSVSNQARILQRFDNDFYGSEMLARQALELFKQTDDKRGIEDTYEILEFSLFSESKFDETYEEDLNAYFRSQAKGDSAGICDALSGIGLIHLQEGNYDSALIYLKQAQEIALTAKDSISAQDALFAFGELYRAIGDYSGAQDFYRRAFEKDNPEAIRIRIKDDWDIWLRMEYAELFSLQHQFDSAWHYYHLFDTTGATSRDLRIYLVSTGETYLLQGQYEKALSNLNRGLAIHRKLNDRNEIKRALLDVSRSWYQLGNDDMASQYAREGIQLAVQTKSNQFIRDGYEILYLIYDRQHRNDSAYYYYKFFNEQKDIVLNDQVRGRIAAFNYDQKIELLNKEKLISDQQLNFQQQRLHAESRLRNILIGCLTILLALGLLVYRNINLRVRNERLRNEKAKADLQRKTVDLEMQALRAQMNPHFIFNCLNSINRFILKNETMAASDYLTKFSRLIRMVLVNSKNKLVTLEDELDTLKLYLDMERLRFKNSFDYGISFINSVDPQVVMVPPMLLQPFCENAIWHGLMNKPGHGRLDISFFLESEDMLVCRIADNGIGRQAASLLKSKSVEKQKSMGLKITQERLELMNGNHEGKTYFEVEDLFDNHGQPAGTAVTIRISARETTTAEV
ncbi:MAG TPA: histidine kinase [Puia sp.]|nr:histidine kinase [Puia sp.]